MNYDSVARMLPRPIDVAVVVCGAVLLAVAWTKPPNDPRQMEPSMIGRRPRPVILAPQESIAAEEQRLRVRNPFGFVSAPEMVQQPQIGTVVPNMAPRIMPTQIALQGVAGPPWTAVLSGLPGRPAQAVVMVGDTIGNVRIRVIRRDTVVVQLGDSTVRLALARRAP